MRHERRKRQFGGATIPHSAKDSFLNSRIFEIAQIKTLKKKAPFWVFFFLVTLTGGKGRESDNSALGKRYLSTHARRHFTAKRFHTQMRISQIQRIYFTKKGLSRVLFSYPFFTIFPHGADIAFLLTRRGTNFTP